MNSNYLYAILILISFTIPACTGSAPEGNTSGNEVEYEKGQSAVVDDVSEKTIFQIAASSPDHTTLAAAVVAAGLEDVLSNPGPLTVFAPNNEAFEKLPEGTLDDLLKPENKSTLKRIITFHASPGEYKGALLKDGMNLYQATGHYIKVGVNNDQVTIAGANVIGTVEASNGVVHVIDQVLLPPD
jgi:uncharacterized surface protein with fasciclin (FAS1) repeats